MNHLIICNSPYQVFNSINILKNDINLNHHDCDVIIDDSFNAFKNAKNIGDKLIERGLCRNVYYSHKKPCSFMKKIALFLEMLFCNYDYDFSDVSLLSENYDAIWVGDGNPLGCFMYTKQNKPQMVWYDDGLSSYCVSPRSFGHGVFYDSVMKMLKLAHYKYRPGRLYVNNSRMAKTKDFTIHSLPLLDSKNPASCELKQVFGYSEEKSRLKSFKLIVLGQVLNSMQGYNGDEMLHLLNESGMNKQDILIRKHPRDKADYSDYNVDFGDNMWELECMEAVREEQVLVSCCSTAQLTPKLLANKEPYLVFLFKLCLNNDSPLISVNTDAVNTIKEMYVNKEKICIPENVNELSEFINRAIS